MDDLFFQYLFGRVYHSEDLKIKLIRTKGYFKFFEQWLIAKHEFKLNREISSKYKQRIETPKEIKIFLSNANTSLKFDGKALVIESVEIQKFFDPLVMKIKAVIEKLFESNVLFSKVYMIGGLSASKYIESCINDYIGSVKFGKRITLMPFNNPIFAVAKGAIEYGKTYGEKNRIIFKRMTPKNIGVEVEKVINGEKEKIFEILQKKNTPIDIHNEIEKEFDVTNEGNLLEIKFFEVDEYIESEYKKENNLPNPILFPPKIEIHSKKEEKKKYYYTEKGDCTFLGKILVPTGIVTKSEIF